MAKKIIAVFVFSFLVLILAGCSKGENKEEKNQNAEQTKAQETNREESTNKKAKGLPSELASACEGKSEGDSCEASMPVPKNGKNEDAEKKKMTGTCKKASDGDQLVCFSNDMPSKPEGGLRNK
jgi:hypothetical protein